MSNINLNSQQIEKFIPKRPGYEYRQIEVGYGLSAVVNTIDSSVETAKFPVVLILGGYLPHHAVTSYSLLQKATEIDNKYIYAPFIKLPSGDILEDSQPRKSF